MSYSFKQQTSKDKEWNDEAGNSIPFNRTTVSERLKEKKAYKLANNATALHEDLKGFKSLIKQASQEVVDAIRSEHKIKNDSKGNFTWYNFDRTIKVEINVNEQISFDEALIDAAKETLTQLIDRNISGDAFIKSIVAEAFQTSTGKLDTTRILGLKKHTSRITNKEIKKQWDKAMSLIDQSITRPKSKTYFRIWIKDTDGKYQNIDLNLSSIEV